MTLAGGASLKTWMLVPGLVLAGVTVGYCKSTKLITKWKNPEYAGQPFHKILVIGMSNDPATRSDFEDAFSLKVAKNGIEGAGKFDFAAAGYKQD
jgi:hypothetical protein